MTFERPEAWWLLALAAPIVALHLHLRRRAKVDVSSLELWRGLVEGRARRGGLRNVRDAVALAFLLAALAAFAGAAAGPVTGHAASEPRRLAIVIDGSATMTAGGETETRVDQALRRAMEAEERLGPQDELTVWVASDSPQVWIDPTKKRRSVYSRWFLAGVGGPESIASLGPSDLATSVRLALRSAPGASRRRASVLVLTDVVGAQKLRGFEPGEVDLRVGVVDGDRSPRNAGIVAFDVDPAAPDRLLVRIAPTDGSPGPRTILVTHDGVEIGRRETEPGTDGSTAARFNLGLASRRGGAYEARLEPPDDFAADDAAGLVLPATKALTVAVVAERPSPFLVEALRAMPDVVDPARTTLVAPGSVESALAGADVVISDGVDAPSTRPTLAFVADGRRAADKPLLWGVGSHAILQGVDLSPLRIARAVVLEMGPADTPIVASSAGAVGVASVEGARRVRFGFRPEATTLPLEAAFPLLIRNSLRWLAASAPAPRYVVAGEPDPDGDGEIVPYPSPDGSREFVTKRGAKTVLRWVAPRGFRLSPESPVAAMSAAEAVAALPDRRSDVDMRKRYAPTLAAVGAGALVLGALLLRSARPSSPRENTAPPVVSVRPTEPASPARSAIDRY